MVAITAKKKKRQIPAEYYLTSKRFHRPCISHFLSFTVLLHCVSINFGHIIFFLDKNVFSFLIFTFPDFSQTLKKKLILPDFSLTLGRGTVDVRARQNHLPVVVVVVVVVAVVVKLLIIKVSTVLAYKNTNW